MIKIRRATPWDAPAIATVKQLTWPSQSVSAKRIALSLSNTTQVTCVATANDKAVAYLSAFPTMGVDQQKRWELDELAVHPEYRRRGLARDLIGLCMTIGRENTATRFRALVKVDNEAGKRAFAAHDFQCQETVLQLYVYTAARETFFPVSAPVHLVEVNTFSYSGLWLEGNLQRKSLDAAREHLLRPDISLIGVLLHASDESLLAGAQELGYEWAGSYQWWMK